LSPDRDPGGSAGSEPRVALLSGGTGGAKLAAGLQERLGSRLSVIVNTADDTELLGVHVSPDPDLCSYWLSGEIDDERGWGIHGDSEVVFERLKQLGAPSWFALGDLDLATCLQRRRLLDEGLSQTDAQRRISAALGVRAELLPMSNQPVRTRVRTPKGWLGLQEFLIGAGGGAEILEVEMAGMGEARPTEEGMTALRTADVILIGPSNPVISIGPILALSGMRELLRSAAAPVVAVSPFVGDRVLKGPTREFMLAAGLEASIAGVASAYRDLLDGLVVDAASSWPDPAAVRCARLDTLMADEEGRRRLASECLRFAASLA
jgi:LPPG:FO 2-phospho-L-lactate transferase